MRCGPVRAQAMGTLDGDVLRRAFAAAFARSTAAP